MDAAQREGIRQRHFVSEDDSLSPPLSAPLDHKKEEVVWGKTPGGEVFRVPTTHDVVTALLHPAHPKSHLDILNLGLLGLQLVLFAVLPSTPRKVFFFVYFAFWRAAYDAGLGYVLTKQSKRRWIVREVQRRGWLDEKRRPEVRSWIRKQLAGKMGKDYSFDDLPVEYNTWLLFRQAVDIILINDFLSFVLFAAACFRVPEGLSLLLHVLRWIVGILLVAFNVWVKSEAHHVVKDYGWYWGDCFFQRGALVFDGVFELAPHPMYSVGYAWIYGLSLISGSYPVLLVSITAHAAQFAFLAFFENPHIERFYGQRKPLAERVPLRRLSEQSTPADSSTPSESIPASRSNVLADPALIDALSTPSVTEGETASDTEFTYAETETEPEGASRRLSPVNLRTMPKKRSAEELSAHDLLNRYFRRDTILLWNFDIFRATDFMLLLALVYVVFMTLPSLSHNTVLGLHFAHAVFWTLFHSVGLGLLLQAQSDRKFLVRHFLKHYHYPHGDGGRGAVLEAFTNWKVIYNLSMTMTFVSCISLTWKTYSIPQNWTVGDQLLRHTLGLALLAFHGWVSSETYGVLGVFGWFYGDFFMASFPTHLNYSGIYRYLNNPEVVSGAGFFGLALISGSKLVFALSAIRTLSYWWFLLCVENPHMRKLYGDALRKDAGFVKVVKSVASKNAKLLERRAGRHAPEIRRVAKEVKGTIDKVYDETAEALEEFIAKSRPRISEVMQDTKILLRQSRDKLIISRLSNDLSAYDIDRYKLRIVSDQPDGLLRFHLGEEIKVEWQAPLRHSRKDWVGIYRVGANASALVTKVSSRGMWLPVHAAEWDGDIPISTPENAIPEKEQERGHIVFKGDQLPWKVGKYEVRYHHDGKYNVLSLDGPIEIYVDTPETLDFDAVRNALLRVVPLCLDSDPSLVPLSCLPGPLPLDSRDPDDFRFWSERQAARIAGAIRQMFGVEYTPDVVLADANLTALSQRILAGKRVLEGVSE
ncbi:phospholipid methyltransferase-domain-containing protein [Vararia minispora EC-137]|uniref:Phospholipid methyltransferase-domain-containing protein n=1 Tax=Vararia minispora EC-137 TaxID=1314806 RepID=A0ACB8QAI8_9AGAM|nr:phospholipid methyltransferase-domain-containing protein [Vararia minispora EC-137]